jgi:acyl-CoA reductase-like NAD-dependent aldehyde dehydrogenase
MKVRNPRTGAFDHAITPCDAAALERIAADLRARQPAFAALAAEARMARLQALSDRIQRHRPAIHAALEADTGRRAITALEIDTVLGLIARWTARAPALVAEPTPTAASIPGITHATSLSPYPLVGVIAPWNFPLLLALTDAIPALAAGSAVLVKPSEITPRFIAPLMAALAEVPDIPLALAEGDAGTGAALIPLVDFIAFTGSVATGRKVAAAAAQALIPASLELGGKDPLLVLDSADPAAAARIALSASCRGTGQACQSIERIYVARAIAPAFLEALVQEAEAVTLNWPDIAAGDLGPFISRAQAHIVEAQIADALAKGARLLTGGTLEDHGGLWLRPTILTEVTHAMAVMREETFGPVLPVMTFNTVEEGISLANDSDFGLSAAVVAGTLAEAEAVARHLEAGAISLNDGALTALLSDAAKTSFKASGLGPSRAGDEGLTRFLRRRALYAQSGAPLPLAAFSEKNRISTAS